jgi:flagellar hook-basal body complex protein FliE
MNIHDIGPQVPVSKAVAALEQGQQADGSFMDTLKESIQQINQVQTQADQAMTKLVTGQDQSLHQTMIAVEKADLSFQLMMQIRNKIVAAYEEVLRMQV